MSITVTLLYGGALALVFLVLSIRVIQGRGGKDGPSLGDGGDLTMQRRIRAHANFAEYVPIILILIGFLEAAGTAAWIIHSLGASLLLGRIMHGYAFAFAEKSVIGRSGGIVLTLLALLAAGGLAIMTGIGAT
jgi:uncharacterized membrane protein YecN with MAPEG domain